MFDRASLLRRVEGVAEILGKGPRHGVYAICLVAGEPGGQGAQLVPECRTVVRASLGSLAVTAVPGQAAQPPGGSGGIVPDLVVPEWCARMARALSADDSAG